jgi:hypothetical protein
MIASELDQGVWAPGVHSCAGCTGKGFYSQKLGRGQMPTDRGATQGVNIPLWKSTAEEEGAHRVIWSTFLYPALDGKNPKV